MRTKLIIKGAFYFNGSEVLQAHFTGEFVIVDCTSYKTKEEILNNYDKSFFEENKENYIDYEGTRYYYAEYSPYTVDDDFILLSDLSELTHVEELYNF